MARPFNTTRWHAPTQLPCVSIETIIMLSSSSCDIDLHIIMLVPSTDTSSCYHKWGNARPLHTTRSHAPTTNAMSFYRNNHHVVIILWSRLAHRHAITMSLMMSDEVIIAMSTKFGLMHAPTTRLSNDWCHVFLSKQSSCCNRLVSESDTSICYHNEYIIKMCTNARPDNTTR